MWLNLLWAMLGGAAGSGCRFLLSKVITDNTTGTFPWGTFSVNMIGCLAIGILFGLIDRGVDIPTQMRAFLITGFCGGFTTFSTFAHENYLLFNDSRFWILFLYAAKGNQRSVVELHARQGIGQDRGHENDLRVGQRFAHGI